VRTLTAFAGGRVLVGGIIIASSYRYNQQVQGLSFLSKRACSIDAAEVIKDTSDALQSPCAEV
jgi:hypothetical protein